MMIVSIRDVGSSRLETRHVVDAVDVSQAVRRAVAERYRDSGGELDEPVVDVGVYRRVVHRESLLDRRVVIKVREQGELFR